jgi:hypothetical protein
MMDTDQCYLGKETRFTFIDPHPKRLLGLFKEGDLSRCTIFPKPVQEVDLALFEELNQGDLLFVDSSHVVKLGSDVRHILARVLPRLRSGVMVHFHDIFWPFEYPKRWVLQGVAWNEAYFLQAFLQDNAAFTIEYFNHYVAVVHEDLLREKMPLCMKNPGGSLYIKRT